MYDLVHGVLKVVTTQVCAFFDLCSNLWSSRAHSGGSMEQLYGSSDTICKPADAGQCQLCTTDDQVGGVASAAPRDARVLET